MATLKFKAKVLKPRKGESDFEAFLILPKDISDCLPRRGRTTVDVSFSGYNFRVMLEPAGDLSHWLKLSSNDIASGNIRVGLENIFEICPVAVEPEPNVPKDLIDSIQKSSQALQSWENTTTIARVDWVHWIESAKQVKTREKRISDACSMLSEGKRRVCCFDNSGFYSKALRAPKSVGE
ncbi:YdeI/OmpD-associated family protein [Pseudoalteromonas sp. 2CM36K]|uniref:YdeI/OmpD-associated family protein n=1 Tax=Pseudoalteromonas sp. 2CM36K TaxID=2929854 RepID=UPI0020C0239A|nr:YdeI/OmpD-associated family protein [Pseudoalteromonas sp. 2CM36K]MCK8105257.1 YdeI/OmpD-associated family protein [Pseudoalteromonas sp. 2CM36K]